MKNIVKIAFFIGVIVSSTNSYANEAHKEHGATHELFHMFSEGSLVGEPSVVDCTLSGGTETRCYAFTVQVLQMTMILGHGALNN